MDKIDFDELKERLATSKNKSSFDDRQACCWQGYFAALLEWGLITPNQHKKLSSEVPVKEPDPSLEIFIG